MKVQCATINSDVFLQYSVTADDLLELSVSVASLSCLFPNIVQ